MQQKHGWAFVSDETAVNYIESVRLFANDDNAFSTFRQELGKTGILEGYNEGGPLWLDMILKKHGDTVLKEKLELFKRNDKYGTPYIASNVGVAGDICPFTLKYILNGLDIVSAFKGKQFKKIVEVGAGYGALCLIMDSLVDFEEYTIVDLPDVVDLCKKYLGNFPELEGKLKFISCDNLDNVEIAEDTDLFISDSALAECNLETQLKYVNKLLKKSKYGFIVYNTSNFQNIYSVLIEELNKDFEIQHEDVGVKFLYLTNKLK